MKRIMIAAAMAASLAGTQLYAAEAGAPADPAGGTLAPGKAAGVKKAQDADMTIWYVVAGAGIAGVAAVALSQGDTPALPVLTSGGASTTTT